MTKTQTRPYFQNNYKRHPTHTFLFFSHGYMTEINNNNNQTNSPRSQNGSIVKESKVLGRPMLLGSGPTDDEGNQNHHHSARIRKIKKPRSCRACLTPLLNAWAIDLQGTDTPRSDHKMVETYSLPVDLLTVPSAPSTC